MSASVFVTTEQDYATVALEQHAVDHMLEPLSVEQTGQALDVAFRKTTNERSAKLVEILTQLQKFTQRQPARIAVKIKGKILLLDPSHVVAVQAQGNYVVLHRRSASYLLRESIAVMAGKLEPYGFIRIHRSVLVNSSFVEEIKPYLTGEYGLRLKGGQEYKVTRTYKTNLRALAEVWIGTDTFLTE
jgi:two-component system LytT family response regulator